MTKTKRIKKAAAVLMAVVMTFAVLGITAFAEGMVKIYTLGSADNMSLKIEYKDCNRDGARSSPVTFSIKTPRTCRLAFSIPVPRATIKFYKGNNDTYSVAFTTPTYVSGMPSRLTTSIDLDAGDYTVVVNSTDSSKRVSGYFELEDVSGLDGEGKG